MRNNRLKLTGAALEVMEALLKAGANPNLADDEGNTPMTFARERDEPEKVKLLEAHGARKNCRVLLLARRANEGSG